MAKTQAEFFHNEKGAFPSFIEGLDDYAHLKIVHLRGALNVHDNPEVQDFLKKAEHSTAPLNKSIILDMKKVTAVDSATLAGLLRVFARLRKKNHKFGFMNIPDSMRSSLEILKLDDVFLVFESEGIAFTEILDWSKDWE